MTPTTRYLSAFACLAVLTLSAVTPSAAQEAHTHGLARLTLALENDMLEIHFESPAVNLVGFEHPASSPEEKQALLNVQTTLADPTLLFSFAGSNCRAINSSTDIPDATHEEHEEHEEQEEQEEHGAHKDHKDSTSAKDNSHSEMSAEYRFHCAQSKQLTSVSVALMAHFPGIEKIEAMWITDVAQGATSLTSRGNKIAFK